MYWDIFNDWQICVWEQEQLFKMRNPWKEWRRLRTGGSVGGELEGEGMMIVLLVWRQQATSVAVMWLPIWSWLEQAGTGTHQYNQYNAEAASRLAYSVSAASRFTSICLQRKCLKWQINVNQISRRGKRVNYCPICKNTTYWKIKNKRIVIILLTINP